MPCACEQILPAGFWRLQAAPSSGRCVFWPHFHQETDTGPAKTRIMKPSSISFSIILSQELNLFSRPNPQATESTPITQLGRKEAVLTYSCSRSCLQARDSWPPPHRNLSAPKSPPCQKHSRIQMQWQQVEDPITIIILYSKQSNPNPRCQKGRAHDNLRFRFRQNPVCKSSV